MGSERELNLVAPEYREILALREEAAALRATVDRLTAERDAWKSYAVHLENCRRCAEDGECRIGHQKRLACEAAMRAARAVAAPSAGTPEQETET